MKHTRQRDTPAELALRSALHRLGFRYRVDVSPLPSVRRRADIVFGRSKVAVFVDGCFWHGCPKHGTWPKANADWWRTKLTANRRRDIDTNQRLEQAGWLVFRLWSHQNMEHAADEIRRAVLRRSRLNRG